LKVILTSLNARYVHSNLAIRYLKTYANGVCPEINIKTMEFTINDHTDNIVRQIYVQKPDVLGFSCYIWNITQTLEVVEILKKVNKDLLIVLGGPEVSFDAKDLMLNNEYIDFIIKGEGEKPFKEFLTVLKESKDYGNVPGLVYRKGTQVIENDTPPPITDFEQIPFPYDEFKSLKNKIVYYESSRGCPFRCQYCLSSTAGNLRFLPLKRVKEDLLKLIEHKPKQVKFVDRTFNCVKSRALDIWKFIMEHDNGVTNFHFEICADLLDDEMLALLSRARTDLIQFEIGVQSTHKKTLEAIQRKMDLDRLKASVKQLRKNNNIHLHLDLIAGLPYEGYNRFKKSFNDVYNLQPEMLQLGFLKLLKGSGLRKTASEHGYVFKDNPPYEVLKNNYIEYDDLLRLKSMEELLEKYYNTHRFDTSLNFVIVECFDTPFDFYEEFASFWETKGYFNISHSNESLYKILYQFYQEKGEKHELFRDILKFDYLLHNRHGKIFSWFNKNPITNFKNRCFDFLKEEGNIKRYLPEFVGLPAKKIYKKVNFEGFLYDVTQIHRNPKKIHVEKKPTAVLFKYNTGPQVIKKAWFCAVNI